MHVEECYFHEGNHYGYPGCYHETVVEPEEMQPGWTAQTLVRETPSYWPEDDVS